MDKINELHRLYMARRPHSDATYYAYRTSKVLHLHFRSRGCRYSKCLCCDYGRADACITKADIDMALKNELDGKDERPQALLLGTFGSLLDTNEFSKELLKHLLQRVSEYGVRDVTIETSWWSIGEDVVRLVVDLLPNTSVTFECGLESSDEATREICHGKALSTDAILRAVQIIHDANASVSVNVMLGAPFLSVDERMKDAYDSVLWALEEVGVDDVVLFPVNIRPYTALRALYDLALYEPVHLWELVEVLDHLPKQALSRTHIAWWGNQSTSYSLGNIAPLTCDVCAEELLAALQDYASSSFSQRETMAAQRRAILDRLKNDQGLTCECRHPYQDCAMPSEDELWKRRAQICERISQGGDAKLVWVSPRESDLNVAADMFMGSSTVYGSNADGNRCYCAKTGCRENHNEVTQEQINSMARDQVDFATVDECVRFMAYNPYYTHGGNPFIVDRSVCLNDAEVLNRFCDKRSFRCFACRFVNVPDFTIQRRSACTAEFLVSLYPEGAVVQRGISSGGEGTFVIRPTDGLPDELDDPDELLLVSRFSRENIPINVHAVLFEKAVVLMPGSTQLIEYRDGKLLYCGCDFVSFADLSEDVREDFYRQARLLCAEMIKSGYRGILGLDAMVVDGKVLFLEMNARFQASSHALNQALSDADLPTLHQLQREAFLRAEPSINPSVFESLVVGYSTFAYSSRGSRALDKPVEYLLKVAQRAENVSVFDDGLDLSQPRKDGAYLFGIMVNGRVSSIHFDRLLNVDQNISCWGDSIQTDEPSDEASWMNLKIALLNQGCTISRDAARAMENLGGVREGVNDAIDLEVFGHVVNVPIRALHQDFSPFRIEYSEENELELYVYGSPLCHVTVSYRDQVQGAVTPSGVPISRICLLATDRLRVQHHDCCDIVEHGLKCKFCNFPEGHAGFDQDDIDFAVASYLDSGIPFRHFLVGGGSDLSIEAFNCVLSVVKSIRSRCDKPIYLMDLPPSDVSNLVRLKEAGVTEVAFNIEVFDRQIARKVMPFKGAIPLQRYLDALDTAVKLWGRSGDVRSALVVGIEPLSSTLAGVEMLASMGVAPILSVFRPVAYSEMDGVVGPDNAWLVKLYDKASAICSEYGLALGPECEACRNNVLAP